MLDDALAWAGQVLGGPITAHERLDGGITSTMLALTDHRGQQRVLRLMTEQPWRSHGESLTRREREAQRELATTSIPAPTSLALDAEGTATGVPAHLMTRLPGAAVAAPVGGQLATMADMLAQIHDVEPSRPFRRYQSWAPPSKWVVPAWTAHADSWRRAFALLAEGPPEFEPVFLHRDFSHRNLLWHNNAISGVIDWVETSSGPAWLDAAHAATNLAVFCAPSPAQEFLTRYSAVTGTHPQLYWLVMDAVGFLPVPGREPLFASPIHLAGLDAWLHHLVSGTTGAR